MTKFAGPGKLGPSNGDTPLGLLEHEGVTLEFPYHILLTTDAVGGVWSYSLELARALGTWGIQLELAGPRTGPE